MRQRDKLLLGREEEIAALRRFLAGAAVDGRALLLTGPPGIGRTALLDEAAVMAAATGALVTRATGAADEADLAFAGLSQLLAPLTDAVDRLAPRHRAVLSVVLGMSGAPDGGTAVGAVAAAVIALLEAEAGGRPVVVVVDDLPVMDVGSVECLRLVGRSLAGHRIGVLVAARSGAGDQGLPEHEVGPVSRDAAASLLAARAPRLARVDRDRVLRAAEGNPLVLWELPLRPGQVPGPRLATLFGGRVAGLHADVRRLLLLAALAQVAPIPASAGGATADFDDPVPALEERHRAGLAGLVVVAGHRVAFAHPAVRFAVIAAAGTAERRAAHAVLASLVAEQPDRSTWHRSEAASGPDEEIARALEESGSRLLAGGDAAGAVIALRRCADLTPAGPSRACRSARAAYVGAAVGGDLEGAAPQLRPDRSGSLWAAVARGYLLFHGDGDLDAAHRVLVDGLEVADAEPRSGIAALTAAFATLLMICRFADRPEFWSHLWALAARHDVRVPPEMALSTDAAQLDPEVTVWAGWAALSRDRLDPCRPALRRVLDDGWQGGAAGSAINAATLLALDAFAAGQWDEAVTLAQQAIALSSSCGHTALTMPAHLALALVAAGRGDEDTCRDLTSRMIDWAAPRGARLVHQYAAHARALAALGRGDAETAYHQACTASHVGAVALDGHSRLLVMDLVEAAVRSRRPEEAMAHVRAAQKAGTGGFSARSALLVAGAVALAAHGDEARRRYEEALAVPGAAAFPFELARVRLAYGEHLRRTRVTLAARLQLTTAVAIFRGLGADPWIARAESELRATGHRTLRARGPVPTTLSHQERTVAVLAATGATNRQIAERLGLSPRTVGSHLSRVFRKLGVASRAALGDALSCVPAPVSPRAVSGQPHRGIGSAAPVVERS